MKYVYVVVASTPCHDDYYPDYDATVGVFETPYDARRACADHEETFQDSTCKIYRYEINGRKGGELVKYDKELNLFFVWNCDSMKKEVIE